MGSWISNRSVHLQPVSNPSTLRGWWVCTKFFQWWMKRYQFLVSYDLCHEVFRWIFIEQAQTFWLVVVYRGLNVVHQFYLRCTQRTHQGETNSPIHCKDWSPPTSLNLWGERGILYTTVANRPFHSPQSQNRQKATCKRRILISVVHHWISWEVSKLLQYASRASPAWKIPSSAPQLTAVGKHQPLRWIQLVSLFFPLGPTLVLIEQVRIARVDKALGVERK